MILCNAGKPRPVGGELQSEYNNRPQDSRDAVQIRPSEGVEGGYMNLIDSASYILSIVASTSILQLLVGKLVFTRLHFSVKQEYDIGFKQAEMASSVAELFSEWNKGNNADKAKLNKLVWEATLWLPDDILKEVYKQLSYQPGHKQVKEIIIDIRKSILKKSTSIKPEEIIHF